MDLRESIEQYQQQFVGGPDDRQRDARIAALDVLQEFLGDYASLQNLEALTVDDLEEFFIDWYLRQPGSAAAVAVVLLDTVREWLAWSDGVHGLQLGKAFDPLYARLREDLPRILEARDLLAQRLRQSRREEEEEAGLAGLGAAPAAGFFSSGLNRILRPQEIDYAAAREDYFIIQPTEDDSLILQSPAGKAMGEEPVGPVRVPPRAAALLRPGDVLHVEVAPGPDGWEILELSQALPGGYRASERYHRLIARRTGD